MKRREARAIALQILYQLDLDPDEPEKVLGVWRDQVELPESLWQFVRRLVCGVWEHREEIDHQIERFSHRWRVDRMDRVDRNILRMGVYELFWCDDIPMRVAINEAVELGKKYGSSEDSKGFINAILDRIAKSSPKEVSDGRKGPENMDGREANSLG